MTLDDYQIKATATAAYGDNKIIYPALGLCGEAGEVAEKVKKVIRDRQGKFSNTDDIEIAKELGDVLWYVAMLASDLGYSLDHIAHMNIDKLSSRKDRGVISGSGDNR